MFKSPKFLYDLTPDNGGGTEPLTKEAIDKQNVLRGQLGQEPLTYPQEAPAAPENKLSLIEQFRADKTKELTDNNTAGLSEEEITNEAEKLVQARAAEIEVEQNKEKERLRIEAEKSGSAAVIKIGAKGAVETKVKEDKPEITNPNTEDDIDESVLLKQLSKKAGKEITSLDEFFNPKVEVTPEEKEKQLQERENNKVAFALQNKIISKQEIESFIKDSGNLQSVAFEFYTQQQLALDETLSDKEIEESFNERFFVDADKESREYKQGQQEINFIANSIISKKHSKYLNLENTFSEYENQQNQEAQRQQKILQLSPSYKKDVDTVIKSISKIKIGEHEVELEQELLDSYKSQMLNGKYSEAVISNGWTLDNLETSTKNHVILDNLESIVQGILGAEKLKYEKGQRGVIPPKNTTAKLFDDKQTDALKDLQQRLGVQTS